MSEQLPSNYPKKNSKCSDRVRKPKYREEGQRRDRGKDREEAGSRLGRRGRGKSACATDVTTGRRGSRRLFLAGGRSETDNTVARSRTGSSWRVSSRNLFPGYLRVFLHGILFTHVTAEALRNIPSSKTVYCCVGCVSPGM